MTAGFVAVFGGYGLLAGSVATAVQPYLPWLSAAGGVLLAGAGVWLASGRELPLRLPLLRGQVPDGSVLSLMIYGAWYAAASLSCTIAPFLAVTAAAVRSGGLLRGVAVFGAYALGMGLVVGVLSMATAVTRSAVTARTRALLPYVSRASGVLLLVTGCYVAYYGWYELRVNAGGSAADPVIAAAAGIQERVIAWVGGIGPVTTALAFCLLAAADIAAGAVRHRRARRRGAPRCRQAEDQDPAGRAVGG